MTLRISSYVTDYDNQSSDTILFARDLITVKVILHKTCHTDLAHTFMLNQNYVLKQYWLFDEDDIISCKLEVEDAPNYALLTAKTEYTDIHFNGLYKTLSEFNFRSCTFNAHDTLQTSVSVYLCDANNDVVNSFTHQIRVHGVFVLAPPNYTA